MEKVPGVGPKSAEKLKTNGIETAEDLACARPGDVAGALNISMAKAKALINSAKTLVSDTLVTLITAKELAQQRIQTVKYIKTGSTRLDEILGGGVQTDALTSFVGRYGTGKTQICHQLCVNTVLDHGEMAAYIETESHTFSHRRIIEMAKAKDPDVDPARVLDNIYVVPASEVTDPFRQFIAYERINTLLKEGKPIRLLCIDSFSARFREFYQGREVSSERSQETARHVGMLHNLASKHNMAVVLTIQVYGQPDPKTQAATKSKMGIPYAAYGGEQLLHSSTYWVTLDYAGGDIWEAFVMDAPDLPRKSAQFRLMPEGVRDT